MAISLFGGAEGGAGVKLTCILYEGAITTNAVVFGQDGYHDNGVTLASLIRKDQWVQIDGATDNTFDATNGLPVVETLANAAPLIGKVITEPKWVTAPPTTNTVNWAGDLARGAFRVATVWFPTLVAVAKVTCDGQNKAAIVPGDTTDLVIDASLSNAAAAAGLPETLIVKDAENNPGANLVPLHYAAAGAVDVSLMVGFTAATPTVVA